MLCVASRAPLAVPSGGQEKALLPADKEPELVCKEPALVKEASAASA